MSHLDKQNTNDLQGLSLDGAYENNVTFALNLIKDSHDGGRPFYQSEPGTSNSYALPTGYKIVGFINGKDNEILIFSTNGTMSEIGLFRQDRYTTLVNADLDFNQKYPITGEYRVKNGCEDVWYWCDHLNPDRWFNSTKPEDFKTAGNWDIQKFSFSPVVSPVKIDLESVNDTGGTLAVGSYYFQIELLDKDNNTIYKSDISPQVVIFDDPITNIPTQIDGAVNYPQFDQDAGGVPLTNKSITLKLSNLDSKASFVKINVAYQVTANLVLQAHTTGNNIPVDSNTIYWNYTGFNPSNGDSLIDFTSLIIPNQSYYSSYVMEQVMNRMVRANIKSSNIDFSLFQAYANSIQMKWVAQESEMDLNTTGNPVNPLTYWYRTTAQGDEVYDFGIQYLLNTGEWTPVFHIPGRSSVSNDTTILTVVSNGTSPTSTQVRVQDVEHLPSTSFSVWAGTYLGSQIQKWKVFNTATITTVSGAHPYTYEGEFGYYESDENYPSILDCEDNEVFGNLANTPVRYHRFPNRRLVPLMNDNYITHLGVKFLIGSLPLNATGYKIVQCNLGTVTESGYLDTRNLVSGDLIFNGSYGSVSSSNYATYSSVESQYQKALISGEYLAVNTVNKINTGTIPNLAATFNLPTDNGNTVNNAIISTTSQIHSVPQTTNYKIDKQVLIDEGARLDVPVLGLRVENRDFWTNFGIIKTITNFEDFSSFNGGQTTSSLLIVGPGFVNSANTVYFYKKKNSISNNFFQHQYNYITYNTQTNSFGTSYHFDKIITRHTTTRLCNTNYLFLNNEEEASANLWETIYNKHLWLETDKNASLRYRGLTDEFYSFKEGDQDITFVQKYTDVVERTGSKIILGIKPSDQWISEYYKLNIDYNKQLKDTLKIRLNRSFDYCSECLNNYPNRVVFSPVSFSEENDDKYRTNLINDYIELPGHRGAIRSIKYRNNILFVHCEEGTFMLQPNPQVLQTEQSQVYLTTGDFLSLPPSELLQSDLGFGGCQSKQAVQTNEFAHVWIDQKNGQILSYDNKLNILSDIGLSQWFKENLPSKYLLQLDVLYNTKPSYISTIPEEGYGVHIYFDPRYKRLIITNKDRVAIGTYNDLTQSGMQFNLTTQQWDFYTNGVLTVSNVSPNDISKFKNHSWTLSFDFRTQRWISWHSYIPYIGLNDNSFYYTLINNVFEKHLHKTSYQTFYGQKYDGIIEYQNFDLQTDRLFAVHYQGYTLTWDSLNETWVESPETFNKMICYNHNQSTGLQNLVLIDQHTNPYFNRKLPAGTKFVIKTDQNYKISGIYDMSVNQPVMTKDWAEISLYGSYIDQIPFNIDLNKSQYKWSDMWDKYVNTRLFFKPVSDSKILFISNQTNEQYSIR